MDGVILFYILLKEVQNWTTSMMSKQTTLYTMAYYKRNTKN